MTFRERIAAAVKAKCEDNVSRAAREAGLEMTTVWRLLNEPGRAVSLRTFACLATWAGIDPREVIEEFTT